MSTTSKHDLPPTHSENPSEPAHLLQLMKITPGQCLIESPEVAAAEISQSLYPLPISLANGMPDPYFYAHIKQYIARIGLKVMASADVCGVELAELVLVPSEQNQADANPLNCANRLMAGVGLIASGQRSQEVFQSMLDALVDLTLLIDAPSLERIISKELDSRSAEH